MHSLDVLFSLVPLPHLKLLHEVPPQVEAGLVTSRRQGILKGSLFSHLSNEVHLLHGSGETLAKLQIGNRKHLWHILLVDDVIRSVRIGLRLGLPEHSLHLSGLGAGLLHWRFRRFDAILLNLHHTVTVINRVDLHFWRHRLDHRDHRSLEILVSKENYSVS